MIKKCKLFAILMAVILSVSIMVLPLKDANAADGTVTITDGKGDYITLAPGTSYSSTSLLPNFEGVMPGDNLEERVIITNNATDCDYVKVYVSAKAHDDDSNPLQPAVQGHGDDQETVASMEDFLAQLSMTITNGDKTLYSGDPKGSPGNNVYLGTLASGQSVTLVVNLSVPITLDNKYANRRGEVDWVFTVEKYYNPSVSIELTEVSTPEHGAYRPGEEIHYQITVTNDSKETLKDVVVRDEKLGIEVTIPELAPGESKVIGSTVDGEEVSYIPYTVTQEDAENGSVYNQATVTAKSPDEDYVDPVTGKAFVEDSAELTIVAETIPNYTITVNYLSTSGATLYPSSTQTMPAGSSYDVSGLVGIAIPGYTRTGVEGSVSGTLTGNVVINVRYAVVEEDDPPYTPPTTPTYYTITVRYIDHEGKVLLPSTAITVQAGTPYDVTNLTGVSVKGYTPYGVIGEVTGTANGNVTIIVRYTPVPVEPVIIDPPEPPLAGPAWALLNLICTILTVLIGIFMILSYFKKQEKDDEVEKLQKALEKAKAAHQRAVDSGDQAQTLRTAAVVQRISNELEEAKRRALVKAQNKARNEGRRPPQTYEEIEEENDRKKSKFFGIIPAVGAVIAFILTEDMRLPMTWKDKWTILMVIILLVNAVLAYLTRNKKEDDDEDEDDEKKQQNASPARAR